MSTYLAKININHGGGYKTLYATSGKGFAYDLGDLLNTSVYYEPRIKNPGSLKTMMFGEGTTTGASKVGYGEVVLVNTDGGLDEYKNAAFAGYTLTIQELINGVPTDFYICVMEQPVFNLQEVSIRIKDPMLLFNGELQFNKYGGTNTLPSGLDGTSDIKGKPKPLAYGSPTNVSPICVNTSKLIYQVNDNPIRNVAAASQGGVATASSEYSVAWPARYANDGDRGLSGNAWASTNTALPHWLAVNFDAKYYISSALVLFLRDDYTIPKEANLFTVTTNYSAASFKLQYLNDADSWVDVPGTTVTGNTYFARRFTFDPIYTAGMRVYITANQSGNISYVTEFEAYSYTQNHDGLTDVSAVYDKAVKLVQDGYYCTQADMETYEPPSGKYRVWQEGGMFRLGSTSAGQLTADVVVGFDATKRTTAKIGREIIRRVSGSPFFTGFSSRGGCSVAKTATINLVGGSSAYNGDCYSTLSITGPSIFKFKPGQTVLTVSVSAGLVESIPVGYGASGITYRWTLFNSATSGAGAEYPTGSANLYDKLPISSYAVTDEFSIIYDGIDVVWLFNDLEIARVYVGENKTFYVNAAFYDASSHIDYVSFEVYNPNLQDVVCIDQDFTDLDTANDATLGVYFNADKMTIRSALDEVFSSIGAWYGFDASGQLNVGRLDSPSGTSEFDLNATNIIKLEKQPTNDEGRGIPVWKINFNYNKNYTVQTNDLAGNLLNLPKNWVQGTFPSSNGGISITYGNGIFIVLIGGGSSTTTFYTSVDGLEWTQRTFPVSAYWRDVIYANGTFVAISNGGGAGSTIGASSSDGITWTQRTLPNAVWRSLAYGNGTFVAISTTTSTIAATSPDGITWTQRTLPGAYNWEGVAYGNDVFVTMNFAGTYAATSPDGITWTLQNTFPASLNWRSIAYGNGTFVAVTYNGNKAATSPDGITWTQRTLPSTQPWMGITYGGGMFVSMAYSGKNSALSYDGITWSLLDMSVSAAWISVVYGDGRFVAVVSNSTIIATCDIVTGSKFKQLIAKEYRTVPVLDSNVKRIHRSAIELNLNSLIVDATDAETEANRQLTMRKNVRDFLAVEVKRSGISSIPTQGKILRVIYPRFGYDIGKPMVVVGSEMFLETNDITLYLWG